jgi:hypothetical protein
MKKRLLPKTWLATMLLAAGLSPAAFAVNATQLRIQDCGNTCANLSSGLAAVAVQGATQYEFQVLNSNDNSVFASKLQSGRTLFLGTVTPQPQYGTSYKIAVRANVGGVFGPYGDTCTIGLISDPNTFAPPATQLRAIDCNAVVLKCGFLLADPISCATAYEFVLSHNGNGIASQLQTSNQLAIWSITPALIWNNTYQVKVRAYRGTVAGPYGATCTISTAPDPGVNGYPLIQVRNEDCGGTFPINATIYSTMKTMYQDRTSPITRCGFDFDLNGVTAGTYLSTTNRCPLNLVMPALVVGNTYQVRVRPWICQDHTGLYGAPCNITILSANRYIVSNGNENEDMIIDENGNPIENYAITSSPETAILQTAIYPQPATDRATLLVPDLEENESYSVAVTDLNGRIISFYENLNQNNFELPIASLDAGMYLVEVKTNKGKQQKNKLLIAK